MKRLFISMSLLVALTSACKKKEDIPSTATNNTVKTDSAGYYKIGTVLNSSTKNTVTTSVQTNSYPFGDFAYTYLACCRTNSGGRVAMSNNELYVLYFQTDGNLVLYKRTSRDLPFEQGAIWATDTFLPPSRVLPPLLPIPYSVTFESDGMLLMRNDDNSPYWASNITSGPKPIWVLQDDGNFVGYNNYAFDQWGRVVITGGPFAATFTKDGNKSDNFGRFRKT